MRLKMEEDEMGKAFRTNRGKEECLKDFGGKARSKKTTREIKM
jgi:hypothetical protein